MSEWLYDTNYDGWSDVSVADHNDNGVVDTLTWDSDFDGYWDQQITDSVDLMGPGVWFPPTEMPMGYDTTGNLVVDGIVNEHNNTMVDIWLQPSEGGYDGYDTDGDGYDW